MNVSRGCWNAAKWVMYGSNTILLFFGVVFAGVALYRNAVCGISSRECNFGFDELDDLESFESVSGLGTIIIGSSGAVLWFIALLGFVAVYCRSRACLCIYSSIVILLIVGLGISGVLLLAYGGIIPNDEIERMIVDLQASVYDECCFETGFVEDGAPVCGGLENITDLCLEDEIDVDESVCDFLETFEVADIDGFFGPLVGNTTEGGCGGGEGFEGFVDQFMSLQIVDTLVGFAVGELVCAFIFTLTLMASLTLLCSREPAPKYVFNNMMTAHSLAGSGGRPIINYQEHISPASKLL